MASGTHQLPPMTYAPRSSAEKYSPPFAYQPSLREYGSTPANPNVVAYPEPPLSSRSLRGHHVRPTDDSEKGSFSSRSSDSTSPNSFSYSPAVQSALRDSYHSDLSSYSRDSAHGRPQTHDPEKRQPSRASRHSERIRTRYVETSSDGYEEREDENMPDGSKAFRILAYLAGMNCVVAVGVLVYTMIALLASTILLPFRVCTSSSPFRTHLVSLLAPSLRMQLSFIHSPSGVAAEHFSAPMLLLINFLSPVVALGIAGASWVAAAFWFFNAILGDPDGSDKPKGYNDGRACVMEVRKWWERWLVRPIRP